MIHFTADLHLGHNRVLGFANRFFDDIQAHDDFLIDSINHRVARRDTLFILGDFCWKTPGHYRARIKCRNVWLIWGNHDKASYRQFFSRCEDTHMAKLTVDPGIRVWLSHYPHAYWPKSHHGAFHLYGHMHDAREELLDLSFPARRAMDCGVDSANRLFGDYRPFSEVDVLDLLGGREGHDSVEYYRDLEAGE